MLIARGRGEEEVKNYYFRGAGFQFHKMKRVLEMDGDDGCTIMWKYLMPLNCQKKETWLKILNFMFYIYI